MSYSSQSILLLAFVAVFGAASAGATRIQFPTSAPINAIDTTASPVALETLVPSTSEAPSASQAPTEEPVTKLPTQSPFQLGPDCNNLNDEAESCEMLFNENTFCVPCMAFIYSGIEATDCKAKEEEFCEEISSEGQFCNCHEFCYNQVSLAVSCGTDCEGMTCAPPPTVAPTTIPTISPTTSPPTICDSLVADANSCEMQFDDTSICVQCMDFIYSSIDSIDCTVTKDEFCQEISSEGQFCNCHEPCYNQIALAVSCGTDCEGMTCTTPAPILNKEECEEALATVNECFEEYVPAPPTTPSCDNLNDEAETCEMQFDDTSFCVQCMDFIYSSIDSIDCTVTKDEFCQEISLEGQFCNCHEPCYDAVALAVSCETDCEGMDCSVQPSIEECEEALDRVNTCFEQEEL